MCHSREQDFAPWLSIRRRRPAWLTSYPVSGDFWEFIRLCLEWRFIEFSTKNSTKPKALLGSPSHELSRDVDEYAGIDHVVLAYIK